MKSLGRERGASLVEFAFVLPILAMLVFGMVDFGVAFNDYISLRQGARDGARQAVVARFGPTTSCDLASPPPSTQTQQLMCTTKDRVGLDQADTRVKVIVDPAYGVGDPIVVCAQYPISSVTNLFPFLNGKQLKATVKMRAEQVNASFTSGEETPPPGGSWTWCTA